MAAKKCCERCEKYIQFNYPEHIGVCIRSMHVTFGSGCCDLYALDPKLRKRKRGDHDGKADKAAD